MLCHFIYGRSCNDIRSYKPSENNIRRNSVPEEKEQFPNLVIYIISDSFFCVYSFTDS